MDRTVRALIRKHFFSKDRLHTKVPNATFHVSVGFIIMFSLVMLSLTVPWLKNLYPNPHTNEILVLNAPDSYIEFLEQEESPSYPFGEILTGRTTDAYFDFIRMSKLMKEEDAFMTIVFPKDFDYYTSRGQEMDILTYYKTNRLDHTRWKDDVVDFHLESYRD